MDGHFSVIDSDECRHLLRLSAVGRLAWSDTEGLHILPVTFDVADDQVLFRTRPESSLARASGAVAFEVDDLDTETRTGWSVVVAGHMAEPRTRPGVEPWAPGERDLVRAIDIVQVTGRSVAFGEVGEIDVYQ